ncbi:hypothetical protein Sango_2678600 [Sesamum angolense]|uniref:Uncharacterized protein n=1 Tax=Sesamum angolense TaxID=2727404 RepID=A0AAE1W2H3_9LAMI|nr:hypothetical protein Sango_2678600 [Sesamum angolense]
MMKVFEMTDLGFMSYFLGMENKGKVKFSYARKRTRPDILSTVSILSRFMHYASELHPKAAKRLIRYVKGTSDFCVKFTRRKEFKLVGFFFYSDRGGSIDDMRSTSGYCFTLGSGVFSWSSKKQEIVVQSIAKAEFIAAIATINQAVWLYG